MQNLRSFLLLPIVPRKDIRGDCTQILACKAPSKPEDGRKWMEAHWDVCTGLTQIYRVGDVSYFGHL